MVKVMIHTCKQRFWYVNNFLVPSLKNQGLENIEVYIDNGQQGILNACIDSFSQVEGQSHTWHLQDDVVICDNFKDIAESYEHFDGIVCGICTRYDGEAKSFFNDESNELLKMWFSFPCIRIPDVVARCFAFHFKNSKTDIYDKYKKRGTGDDACFRRYIRKCLPSIKFINANPNLVDHIDYLIGGSSSPLKADNTKPSPAIYFDEEITKRLKMQLSKYKS